MRRGASINRAPLVPKELILPVCQRLAFVLFAMCSTALGIRLYARYKLGTLGAKPSDRMGFPVNGTHFFLDIGGTHMDADASHTKKLEDSGWKGVCAKPFPDADRSCEPISMPVVAVDGEEVMVADCSAHSTPLQVMLSTFSACPNVARVGVGIANLLKISKAPRVIDFVNLDTDGSEEDIIQRFPFKDFCVRSWAVKKAAPVTKIPAMLKAASKCTVKEAGVGYFARCSCSGFEQSLLQREASTAPVRLPKTQKRKVMPFKVNRPKSRAALVSSRAEAATDEITMEDSGLGMGSSLMRRSFA